MTAGVSPSAACGSDAVVGLEHRVKVIGGDETARNAVSLTGSSVGR